MLASLEGSDDSGDDDSGGGFFGFVEVNEEQDIVNNDEHVTNDGAKVGNLRSTNQN